MRAIAGFAEVAMSFITTRLRLFLDAVEGQDESIKSARHADARGKGELRPTAEVRRSKNVGIPFRGRAGLYLTR